MTQPNKTRLTWEQFHQDVKVLCQKIKESGSYNKIIAISRGGLIPAGIVAYELNIRNMSTVNIISYHDDRQLNKADVFGFDGQADRRTLIIDDLSDTGRSIKLLRQLIPNAVYATVYAKPDGLDAPDIYAKEMPNSWVAFPWDV